MFIHLYEQHELGRECVYSASYFHGWKQSVYNLHSHFLKEVLYYIEITSTNKLLFIVHFAYFLYSVFFFKGLFAV